MFYPSKLLTSLAVPRVEPSLRLSLVPSSTPKAAPNEDAGRVRAGRAFLEVAGERCSAYLAEAAVLVLVFAILDRFLMKERMEWTWASGALLVSLGLLAASVAVEVAVRRLAD